MVGDKKAQIAWPEIDKAPEMSHALGWGDGLGLCGTRITPRAPKHQWPDCVVCCDLWLHMNEGDRQTLRNFWGIKW